MELKNLRILIGVIILFAGIDVTILTSHLSRWVGVLMIFIGLAILLSGIKAMPKIRKEVELKNLGARLINFISFKGRLIKWFPIVGIGIINVVFLYNIALTSALSLASFDYSTILLGAMFISYNYIPSRFSKERNFVFLFFLFLFLILVLPLTIYSMSYGKPQEYTNSPVIYYLLAKPVSSFLNLFGIWSAPYQSAEYGVVLRFALQDGSFDKISIGLSCSGLYSVSVFVSLFISYVMTAFNKIDKKLIALLILGIGASYLANLLRITIVVVGSYYGMGALLWTHANLGEIIFIGWIVLFWALIFRLGLTSESSRM
ncbi:MAG: exosortase/archaeosortase family protein [Candidatus Thermoplasmatota archaeon]|nr:exosortase/archaeosortase family protein [Candidatus Thermoplasmatota archaeon]